MIISQSRADSANDWRSSSEKDAVPLVWVMTLGGSVAEHGLPGGYRERTRQFVDALGPLAGAGEDGADGATGFLREQPHHADRRPFVEGREEDGVLIDRRDVDILPDPLVKQHRELGFAQQARHRRRGAEGTGGKRRQGDGIQRAIGTTPSEELPAPVDEQRV